MCLSRRLFAAACGCLMAMSLAFPASGQDDDRVTQVEGRALSGRITSVTANGITIEAGGRTVEVEPSNIKMVSFGDEPRDIVNSRRALAEGRLNNALEALEPVDESRLQPPALAADVRFIRAFCTAKLALTGEAGTLDEAAAAIGGFVANDPDSYRYYEACELFGDVLVARGVFDQAEQQYGRLVAAPWLEMQQRGRLKVARTQELQKKWTEAIANYQAVQQVESATAAARQAKLSARVGLARCAAFQGDPSSGIRELQQMIVEESSTNAELFAQIYNALGNCQMQAGNTKAAINAFLHTDLLYYQSPDYHAEALYQLGNLFAQLGKVNEAAEAREKLKSRYAASPWANIPAN